jgi:hypothetical protein
MPSTYSTDLKIELIALGEQVGTWGTTTNTNLGTALEQAVVGRANVSFASDANKTLTISNTNAAQDARAFFLNVSSAVSLTTTRDLIVPAIFKNYIVKNGTTGSQSIRVIVAVRSCWRSGHRWGADRLDRHLHGRCNLQRNWAGQTPGRNDGPKIRVTRRWDVAVQQRFGFV